MYHRINGKPVLENYRMRSSTNTDIMTTLENNKYTIGASIIAGTAFIALFIWLRKTR